MGLNDKNLTASVDLTTVNAFPAYTGLLNVSLSMTEITSDIGWESNEAAVLGSTSLPKDEASDTTYLY